VLEMQAPIQKIKNGRCRKTSKGLPKVERDKVLEVSGILGFYHFVCIQERNGTWVACGAVVTSARLLLGQAEALCERVLHKVSRLLELFCRDFFYNSF